jgi:hypothetical protein
MQGVSASFVRLDQAALFKAATREVVCDTIF